MSDTPQRKPKAATTVGVAGIILMASNLLSRILGLVRDAVIGAMFGTTLHTDAYVISFRIPDLIFYLVAGGAFSSALIPVFTEYLTKDDEEGAWETFSTVATVIGSVVIGLVALVFIFAEPLTPLLAWGKPSEIFPEVAFMGRILLPAQIFFLIGSLCFATLYSKKQFVVPGLGPNLYNLCIIFGAVWLSQFVSPGVIGMCWGALIGAFLGNVIVPVLAVRRVGMKFRPSFNVRHPGASKVFRLMIPVIFGLSLPQVLAFLNNWLCNHYPKGTNTAIDYANKLQQAPVAVFGMAMALAAFPALAEFWTKNERKAFVVQFTRTLTTTAYLCLPIAAVMLTVPDEIVRIFFERGKFTPESTALTAPLLQAFAVGLLGWSLAPIVMRGFYATQETVKPIVIGTIATAFYLAFGFVIKFTGMPAYTVALSSSITGILLVWSLLASLKKRIPEFEIGPVLGSVGRTLCAAALFGALMWGGVQGFHAIGQPFGILGRLGWFGICFILAGWAFYLATKAMKMPEAAIIERAVGRLDKRGKTPQEPPKDEAAP